MVKLRFPIISLFLFVAMIWPPGSLRAEDRFHTVKRHETLGGIARQYRVAPSELAQRNHLKDSNRLLPGQRLIIPAVPKPTEYIVKRGDSLTSIAARVGVSTSALKELNGLKPQAMLTVGQVLLLPGKRVAAAVPSDLTPELRQTLDKIRCSSRWKNIVIHHSGSFLDTPRSMDAYHRTRHMENGLAYHFVIGSGKNMEDGAIHVGNRWIKQLNGGHLASEDMNYNSIGICLVGNFNQRSPSARQMRALRQITDYLMARCRIEKSHVKTHREINTRPTQCPGSKFPTAKFLSAL